MMGAASDEEVPDLIELIRRAPNSDGGGGGYSSDRTTQFVLSALAGNRLSGLVMAPFQVRGLSSLHLFRFGQCSLRRTS